ncbi:aldehyde dehydrogenase family protein [Thermofilum sp.]|uniref:aldehyde dehydrogenase family protein n=1 Tax=Thermofilum sp. TaxID=1961369 RepID=UPI003870E1A0
MLFKFAHGFFFKSTVLFGCTSWGVVMRKATFAPVAPIMKVGSLMEGVQFANDSRYGLVVYFYTRDIGKAAELPDKLEYSTAVINNNVVGGEARYPCVGRCGSRCTARLWSLRNQHWTNIAYLLCYVLCSSQLRL